MGTADQQLLEALTSAYMARARLFHRRIAAANVDLLIREIDAIDHTQLQWDLSELGISATAFRKVEKAGGLPHQVFAHPGVISARPYLIAYYRNIITLSKKGIAQILFRTESLEARKRQEITPAQAICLCHTLNQILSGVIDDLPEYKVSLSRQAILAEIGTELQGAWANAVGRGAAKAVEALVSEYIARKGLGQHTRARQFHLNNGWAIHFGSEPDVAFVDPNGITQIAIEIKGSLDVAGAQTRYGEAKKSFQKQIQQNPRCHTVYLASCYTDAVIAQIKADGQLRDWYNLTSILYDEEEKNRFLERLFHIVSTPSR